ncbi:MAG: redoxin domain-containing protein, partial [Acidobacteria bacterium]|nr:redoxin domain-containing protein [Acidobacteriota bacterium]
MRSARPAILLLLGAVLVFSGYGRAQGKKPQARPSTADPAVIELRDYQKLLEKHRGKPLLVNFWATWCEPCRDEFPMLNELARTYGPQGLQVMGVSLDEDVDINLVRRFLARMSPIFSNFRKKPGKDEDFINGVHLKWSGALPATFFYDREGRMAATLVGEHQRPEFEKV